MCGIIVLSTCTNNELKHDFSGLFGEPAFSKSAYETNFFIALCERTFKIVVQVLLYFCTTLLC